MSTSPCVVRGIKAGLVGGVALAAFFLVLDLVRLKPLATPYALATTLPGPIGFAVDAPVLSELFGILVFGAGILIFTLLHFLGFSLLGVGAIWGCQACGVKLNILTGSVFGLVVCSLAFLGYISLAGPQALAELPGPWSIAGGNLLAGAAMGGYAQSSVRAEG